MNRFPVSLLLKDVGCEADRTTFTATRAIVLMESIALVPFRNLSLPHVSSDQEDREKSGWPRKRSRCLIISTRGGDWIIFCFFV